MAQHYIKQLYEFLNLLARNNNREWFKAHKSEYDDLRNAWLADLDRMIQAMAQWEPSLAGLSARKAAYRIYRDTRFSPDKTPYKTHFGATLVPGGRDQERAGYYLHMSPQESLVYGGIWCPPAPLLAKLRKAIVDNIEEWEEIVANPSLARNGFSFWSSSQLKTVPRGWDKNHPQAAWLRHKDFGMDATLPTSFFNDPEWPLKAAERFHAVHPLVEFLNYSIDEEV